MTRFDSDPRLTAEAKREEKAKAAVKTLAALDASATVRHAEEALASVQAHWATKVAKSIKVAEDANAVSVAAQIRDKVSNLKDSDRMKWLNQNADDEPHAGSRTLIPRSSC